MFKIKVVPCRITMKIVLSFNGNHAYFAKKYTAAALKAAQMIQDVYTDWVEDPEADFWGGAGPDCLM